LVHKVRGLAVSTKDIALATLAEESHGKECLILGSIQLFFAKVNAALCRAKNIVCFKHSRLLQEICDCKKRFKTIMPGFVGYQWLS
jgi:hypothetical protein